MNSYSIHIEDTLPEIKIIKKMCASCWSFSQMCITMHRIENVKKKKKTGVEVRQTYCNIHITDSKVYAHVYAHMHEHRQAGCVVI